MQGKLILPRTSSKQSLSIKYYAVILVIGWSSLVLLLMVFEGEFRSLNFADILCSHVGPIEFKYDILWLLGLSAIGMFYLILRHVLSCARREIQSLYDIDERYDLTEKALSDGLWDWNITTGECYFSPYWKKILGYEDNELENVATTFFDLIWPEDRPIVDEALRSHFEDAKAYEIEFRLKHKDGGYRWILSRGKSLFGKDAKPFRMLGSIRDISKRKKAESELQELRRNLEQNEAYYKLLFESSMDGVFVVDIHTREILDANKQAVELIGYSKAELLKMKQVDLHPDPVKYKEFFDEHIRASHSSTTLRYGEVKHRDGTLIPVGIKAGMVKIAGRSIAIGSFNDLRERQLHELELKASEEKFRALYENAPLSYQSLDENGCFLDVNPAWLKTLGYMRNEVIGHRYVDFLHPDWKSHFDKNFPTFKERGYVHGIQYKIKHKNGYYIDIEFEGCIARNPDGSFKQTYCVFKNVSDRLEVEREIEKSHKLLGDVINAIPDMIWMKDPNGVFLICNGAFEKLLGAPKEKIIGTTDYDHLSKEQSDICTKQDKAASEHGIQNIHEEPIRHAGLGCDIFIEVIKSPVYDNQGTLLGVLGVGRDITDQKRAADALRASEESFAFVIQGSQLGLWDWNLKTNEVKRNARWAEMLGYKLDEIEFTVKQWIDFVHPEDRDRAYRSIQDHLDGKTPIHLCEYRMLMKDGQYRWILDRAKVVSYNEEGEAIRMCGTHADITESKEAELTLRDMNEKLLIAKEKAEQSDQLKTAFLMNLSHEIRTPMNGILGFSELLKMGDLSVSSQKKYIEVIERSGQRMLRLIEDLIDISKIEVGLVEIYANQTDLNQLMDKIYDFFISQTKSKGLYLSYEKDENLNKPIIVDDGKLEQILLNLINNALKFTDKGSIKFSYKIVDNKLLFCVRDSGQGIPAEMKEIIFERFRQVDSSTQRSEDGIGLGLSICKAYVTLMEGDIWIESEVGKGSTFYFSIPLKLSSEKNIVKESSSNVTINDKNSSILIVEDDSINAQYLFEALKTLELKVIKVSNGQEAIKAVEENPDIKVVLMDIKMPIMNGLEATKVIREIRAELPIIAQSAHASETDKQKALVSGCNDYLTKPIKRDALIAKISPYLMSVN